MSGSKKYFKYTTDDSDVFALIADESNTEAVNGSEGDYTTSDNLKYQIPKNITPRVGVYANAERTRTIKCVVLTQAKYNTLQIDTPTIIDPVAGTGVLSLVQKIPERIKLLPQPFDTGLNDGDAT